MSILFRGLYAYCKGVSDFEYSAPESVPHAYECVTEDFYEVYNCLPESDSDEMYSVPDGAPDECK